MPQKESKPPQAAVSFLLGCSLNLTNWSPFSFYLGWKGEACPCDRATKNWYVIFGWTERIWSQYITIRMWNILVFHAYSMTWHVPRKNLTTHLPQSQNVGWKLPVIYFNWLNNQGWILVSDCGWHVLWSCPNWNLR